MKQRHVHFFFLLPMTAFVLQWQSCIVLAEAVWPTKSKLFTILSSSGKVWWPLLTATKFLFFFFFITMFHEEHRLLTDRNYAQWGFQDERISILLRCQHGLTKGEKSMGKCTPSLKCISFTYFSLDKASYVTLTEVKMVGTITWVFWVGRTRNSNCTSLKKISF